MDKRADGRLLRITLEWRMTTPLGTPVEPDGKRIWAVAHAAGGGSRGVAGNASRSESTKSGRAGRSQAPRSSMQPMR